MTIVVRPLNDSDGRYIARLFSKFNEDAAFSPIVGSSCVAVMQEAVRRGDGQRQALVFGKTIQSSVTIEDALEWETAVFSLLTRATPHCMTSRSHDFALELGGRRVVNGFLFADRTMGHMAAQRLSPRCEAASRWRNLLAEYPALADAMQAYRRVRQRGIYAEKMQALDTLRMVGALVEV